MLCHSKILLLLCWEMLCLEVTLNLHLQPIGVSVPISSYMLQLVCSGCTDSQVVARWNLSSSLFLSIINVSSHLSFFTAIRIK